MDAQGPKLLVVVRDRDRAELEAALSEVPRTDVHFGDGGDDTIELAEIVAPDVVLLSAALDLGDARSLAAALKARGDIHVVLLGEDDGPIRNALDASEFEVDRFLARPLSAKALMFAVRSGYEAIQTRRRQAPPPVQATGSNSNGGPELATSDEFDEWSPEQTQVRIDAAMDSAINAFVEDAIAAIPLEDMPSAPTVAPDPDPEPEEREATMVLSPAASAQATTTGQPATAQPATEPEAPGEFARQLNKKMSAMAERLFPGENNQTADFGVSHGAHTEINLSELSPPGHTELEDDLPLDSIGTGEAFSDRDATGTFDNRDVSNFGTQPFVEDTQERMTQPATGVLGESGSDPASLIADAYRASLTGMIEFCHGDATKLVYFERGVPVFATSNLPHDRMGDLLFREGKITRLQHRQSRELVADSGRRMGEILIEQGFLKPTELLPAVRRHLEDIIYSLFAWSEGSYRVDDQESAAQERIRLASHPAALVLEGVRRKYDRSAIARSLGGDDPVIELDNQERQTALASQMELLPSEERVLSSLDGERTLSEAAVAANSHPLSAAQVAFAMVVLGAARVVDGQTRVERKTQVGDTSSGDTDIAIDRQRVGAKYEQVWHGDYFRLLGVRRDATDFEIRRAYEASVRDYAPDAFSDDVRVDLAEELSEIKVVLDEAYNVLSDPRMRAAYLGGLERDTEAL